VPLLSALTREQPYDPDGLADVLFAEARSQTGIDAALDPAIAVNTGTLGNAFAG
jgi:hypothetical protein